jgi:hypothetical protein
MLKEISTEKKGLRVYAGVVNSNSVQALLLIHNSFEKYFDALNHLPGYSYSQYLAFMKFPFTKHLILA